MKLNLGCGQRVFEDSINVDWRLTAEMASASSLVASLFSLPFRNRSATSIYMRHVLEHFSLQGILSVLGECHRALKVLGELYICVPNMMGYYHELWESERTSGALEKFAVGAYGHSGLTPYPGEWHHFGFDPVTLEAIVTRLGFRLKRDESTPSECAMYFQKI